MDYPKYKSPKGNIYTCIGWACGMPKSNWEWYAFEKVEDDIYFGFVHGFEDEFGYFSIQELEENGINFYTNPGILNDLQPPVGWKRL